MIPTQPIAPHQEFERLVNATLADRIFAPRCRDPLAEALPPDRYLALQACKSAESEADIVDTWYARCVDGTVGGGDDPGLAVSKRRLAQLAWTHYGHARAASAGAQGDPVFGPRAALAAARALRAARAISRAAARAISRIMRARAAARARMGAPGRLRYVGKPSKPTPRRRAPTRRVRLSAVASAGSGGGDPSPEPSPPSRDGVCLPARRAR